MSSAPVAKDNVAANDANDAFVAMSRRQRAVVVVSFTLFLVLVTISRMYDPTPVDDWIPTYLAIYVGLMAVPFLFFRSGFGWFHPVAFVVFMSFVQVVRKFSVYAWGLDWHQALPLRGEELSELIELQLLLHSLALGSFYAGFLLAPRLPVPLLPFANDPPRLVRKLILISVLAFAVFLAFILERGGLDAHIAGWSRGRHSELSGQIYKIAIMSFGALACWIWLGYRKNAIYSVMFWACVAVALAVGFLSAGSRSNAIYCVFIGLMIWMLRERRMTFLPIALGLIVAIYVIGALGAYRRSVWAGDTGWEAATETGFTGTITGTAGGEISRRSSSSDAELAVLSRVPDDVSLLWGSSYLAAAVTPVPRAIWPGKPGQVGGLAGRVFFRMDAGAPPGAVGEAYWNFHVPGVIGIFVLFGIGLSWVARTYQRNADKRAAVVLYAPTLFLWSTPQSSTFVAASIPLASLLLIYIAVGIIRILPRQTVWSRPAPTRVIG